MARHRSLESKVRRLRTQKRVTERELLSLAKRYAELRIESREDAALAGLVIGALTDLIEQQHQAERRVA